MADATYQIKAYWKVRFEIFSLLGNQCAKCGFKDYRAFQVDHVKGLGRADMNKFNAPLAYYKHILKHTQEGGTEYQLLCANCNSIKRHEEKENRHNPKYRGKTSNRNLFSSPSELDKLCQSMIDEH